MVNVAIILNLKADTVKSAVITLGAVTPVIIHAEEAEKFLAKKKLNEKNIAQAAELAMQAAHPIDDVRGSAAYRREMVRVITARGLRAIRDETEQAGMPKKPILLQGKETADHASADEQVNFHLHPSKQPLMERNIPSKADTTKHYCACFAKKAC